MTTPITFLFILIVIALILAIIVLLNPGRSRFKGKGGNSDVYRSKRSVGEQNVGTVKNNSTYRDIARDRGLPEAEKLESRVNPNVTKAITSASKAVSKEKSIK